MAAIYDPDLNWRLQWDRWVLIAASLAVGLAIYEGFNLYKFPPGSTASHTEISKRYGPVWAADPMVALLVMSFSLGAGVPFYNPAIFVCLSGFKRQWPLETFCCLAFAAAMTIFILLVISFLTFFKGDRASGSTLSDSYLRRPVDLCTCRFTASASMGSYSYTRAGFPDTARRTLHRSTSPLCREKPTLDVLPYFS